MKNLFKSKKRAVISVVATAVLLFFLVNICASAFFSFALFKRNGWKSFEEYSYGDELKNESAWISEKGRKAELENAEGRILTATEIENEHISHSYAIICHQYGGSAHSMEEYAKHFYDLGFNVLLPDMRGHGESPYNNISFGFSDNSDVTEWIKYIIENDEKARIALFGVSLGAAAVTVTASADLPDNVRLVIADSCYTSMKELLKEYVKAETPFSALLVTELTSAFAKNKIGCSPEDTDTISILQNVELPVMFINGEDDSVVPPLLSKRLYENCEAEGVEEVLIENGTHGRNIEADEGTYWVNIDAFILNNIGI